MSRTADDRALAAIVDEMDNVETYNCNTKELQQLRDVLLDSEAPTPDNFDELTTILDKLQAQPGKRWLLIEID